MIISQPKHDQSKTRKTRFAFCCSKSIATIYTQKQKKKRGHCARGVASNGFEVNQRTAQCRCWNERSWLGGSVKLRLAVYINECEMMMTEHKKQVWINSIYIYIYVSMCECAKVSLRSQCVDQHSVWCMSFFSQKDSIRHPSAYRKYGAIRRTFP